MKAKEQNTRRVAIVAGCIVSPLGFGLTETLQSLQQGRDCVTPVSTFSVEKTRCKTAAQIDDGRLLSNANRRRQERRLHRASYMVMTALAELLEHAPDFEPEIAIVGTTSGGMSFGENFYRTLGNGGACSAALIANYPPQKQIVDAMEKFGINAPAQVIANACASGTNAIGHAFNAIRTGRYQRILAGGYDALSELVFVGFDSLQAATPEKCRPFDSNRSGMVLGESDDGIVRRGTGELNEKYDGSFARRGGSDRSRCQSARAATSIFTAKYQFPGSRAISEHCGEPTARRAI